MAHELNLASEPSAVRRNLPLDTDEIWQARVDLAACLRMAATLGLEEGICNHFSAIVPGHPDLFLVNRLGWAFQEATASSLLICDFESNVVAGDGQPEATTFFIHARLHKMAPRIGAAFHTHMPNATALSMVEGDPLVWAGQTALKFYGRVAVDANYNGLALDEREGDRIARVLGDKDIVFMRNHGLMVCAPSIAEAWDDLYYLERAAEVQLKAMGSGRLLIPVPMEIANETARQMREGASGKCPPAPGKHQTRFGQDRCGLQCMVACLIGSQMEGELRLLRSTFRSSRWPPSRAIPDPDYCCDIFRVRRTPMHQLATAQVIGFK